MEKAEARLKIIEDYLKDFQKRSGTARWVVGECGGDVDMAEDAVATALLRVFKRGAKMNPDLKMNSYINIAVGREIKYSVHKIIRHGGQEEYSANAAYYDGLMVKPEIEDDGVEEERKTLILRKMSGLEEKYKEVLVKKYWEDLTTEKISEEIGIPAGTVKSRLYTARRLLKKMIERETKKEK